MRAPSEYFSTDFMNRIWPAFRLEIKSAGTATEYFSVLCGISDYLQMDFLSISTEDALRYIGYLRERYHNGNLAIRTINMRIAVLRKMGSFIVERGLVKGYSDPFITINQEPVDDSVPVTRFPSIREFDAILSAAKNDDRMYLILALAGRVGLNASKIIKLHRNHLVEIEGRLCICLRAKNVLEKDQVIVLPEDVRNLVVHYIETHPSSDGLLFHNKHGRPLSLRNLDAAIAGILSASGVENNYTIKDFRTRAIIDLKNAGVSDSTVCEYVGISALRVSAFSKAAGIVGDCPADLVNFSLKQSV